MIMGLAILITGGNAFAHGRGNHRHPAPRPHNPPPHHHHDDDASLLLASTIVLELMTLTELSEATTYDYKIAILNASPDALNVLDDQAATDLFINGKVAVEKLLNMKFQSDEEAAYVILEYTEIYSNR